MSVAWRDENIVSRGDDEEMMKMTHVWLRSVAYNVYHDTLLRFSVSFNLWYVPLLTKELTKVLHNTGAFSCKTLIFFQGNSN